MNSRLTSARGAIAGLGLVTIALVGGFEGLRLYSYQDVVGIWTACYGETRNMRAGLRFTKDECDRMFIGSLVEHESGMRACLRAPDAIPDKVYVAFVSLTYNIGVAAFCRSSLARHANDANLRAACDEILKWDRAGGKVVRGLTIRREREHALCKEGIAA